MTEISAESQKAMDQLASAYEPKQGAREEPLLDYEARMRSLSLAERATEFGKLVGRRAELLSAEDELSLIVARLGVLGPLVGNATLQLDGPKREKRKQSTQSGATVAEVIDVIKKHPDGIDGPGIRKAFPGRNSSNAMAAIKEDKDKCATNAGIGVTKSGKYNFFKHVAQAQAQPKPPKKP